MALGVVAVTLASAWAAGVAGARPAIIGGQRAQPGTWKFMAFIEHPAGPGFIALCSGTVVAKNVILTAGHCSVNENSGAPLPPSQFKVYTGSVDWPTGHLNHVSKVIIDPAYNRARGTSDASLLVLSAPIASPPVRLASANDHNLELPGTPAYIAGWGKTSSGQNSLTTRLRWAPTVVQRQGYCAAHSGYPYTFSAAVNLCTVNYPHDNTSTCNGDSGGPLIAFDGADRPVEIGITSYGQANCGTHVPSFYATVRPLHAWVQNAINALGP